MEKFDALITCHPFVTPQDQKNRIFFPAVFEALSSHYDRCNPYRRWCDKKRFDPKSDHYSLTDIPFLPVNIFKRLVLQSSDEGSILKVLKSSATTSQTPSQVSLDRVTRDRQMRVLATSLKYLIGERRRPFIVLDAKPSSEQKISAELSARIAGLRGYLMAASRIYYVLKYNEHGIPELDIKALIEAINELNVNNESFCLLGYTFVLYQHVLKTLASAGTVFSLPESASLIHFGGWKKLENLKVGKSKLNQTATEVLGLQRDKIYDIYGFTEQLGVIYPDDPEGIKRAPVYAEVLVRDPVSLEVVPDGKIGLLEFISPLPHSYPGIAVLTDDMGRILTRQPSSNGWCGTGFEIIGRAKNAEIRGCGDTLPDRVYQGA
ncbi:hypothetical protein [Methylotuvimicrobium sp.]|uniref:LuxE/PaaK family acyltransferase n=1 Tax=Methylotuvimicrobium sp. TaxID=2822413 RepID=UPI003D66073E